MQVIAGRNVGISVDYEIDDTIMLARLYNVSAFRVFRGQ